MNSPQAAGNGRHRGALPVPSVREGVLLCPVLSRVDDAFEHGADVSVVHDVVRELMEEKRASRHVTVPAVMLEKVMALAGSEMKRLYAVGSEKRPPGCKGQRRFAHALSVVAAGPCSLPAGCHTPV